MLKFVGQNEKSNEKSIKEELGTNNLLDFFASSDPKTISEKIDSTLSYIKNKSIKEDSFYTKLIYYFSFLINSKSFKNDSKGKTCIKNLIQICESQKGSKIYYDLFYLFDEYQKEFKKIVLMEIPLSKYNFTEEDLLSLYSLFASFIIKEKKNNKTYDAETIKIFSELIEKKKNYHLLKKIESTENLRKLLRDEMITKKESISNDINTSKLLFFLTLTSCDLVDEDLDRYTLNEKLTAEKKMFDSLENRNDEEILFNKDNKKYFEETYGEKGTELISSGAKETCIHEILAQFDNGKKNNISIKDFITDIFENDDDDNKKKINLSEEEIQNKFEEIEDMLISGKEHKLYNIEIDYLKKEIKILYLRRPQYEEEHKTILLNKIKNMKSKLEIILKAIEKV